MAKGGFDESKDEILMGPVVAETDSAQFELKIVSYNGGEPKLQISRFSETEDGGRRYQKLGRTTRDEWDEIAEAAMELWDRMP